MFERRYCRACRKVVKASVTFLIDGSAMGSLCHSEALMFAQRVPDTHIAKWLCELHGFPLLYDAVRTGRLARRIPLAPIDAKIDDHIAVSPWHLRDESPGKGNLRGGGGRCAPAPAAQLASARRRSALRLRVMPRDLSVHDRRGDHSGLQGNIRRPRRYSTLRRGGSGVDIAPVEPVHGGP